MLNHSFKLNELKLTYMTRHVSQIASMLEMINSAGGLSQIKNDLLNVSVLTEDADKAMLSWANAWKQLQNNITASQGVLMNFMDGPGSMMLTFVNKILGGIAKFDSKIGNSASVGVSTALTTFAGLNVFMKMTQFGKDATEYMSIISKMNKKEALLRHVASDRNLTKAQRLSKIISINTDLKTLRSQAKGATNPISKLTDNIGSLTKVLANPTVLALLGISAVVGGGVYLYKKRQEALIKYSETLKDLNKALSQYNILSKQETMDDALSHVVANQITQWSKLSSTINTASYELQDILSKISDIKPIKLSLSTSIDKNTGTSQFTRNVLSELNSAKPEFNSLIKKLYSKEFSKYLEVNKTKLEAEYYNGNEERIKSQYRKEKFNEFAMNKFLQEEFNLSEFLELSEKIRQSATITQKFLDIRDSKGLVSGKAKDDSKIIPAYLSGNTGVSNTISSYKDPYGVYQESNLYFTRDFSEDQRIKSYQQLINQKILEVISMTENKKIDDITETDISKFEEKMNKGIEIKLPDGSVISSATLNSEVQKLTERQGDLLKASNLYLQRYNISVRESIDSINGFISAINSRIEFLNTEIVKDLEGTVSSYSISGLNELMKNDESVLGRELVKYTDGMKNVLKAVGYDYNTVNLTNSNNLKSIGQMIAIDNDLKDGAIAGVVNAIPELKELISDSTTGVEALSKLYEHLGINDHNIRDAIINEMDAQSKIINGKAYKLVNKGTEYNTEKKEFDELSNMFKTFGISTEGENYKFANSLLKKYAGNETALNAIRKTITGKSLNENETEIYGKMRKNQEDKFDALINLLKTSVISYTTSEMKKELSALSTNQKLGDVSLEGVNFELIGKIIQQGLFGKFLQYGRYEDAIALKSEILARNQAQEDLNIANKNIEAQKDVAIFNLQKNIELKKLRILDPENTAIDRLELMEEVLEAEKDLKTNNIKISAIKARIKELESSGKKYAGYEEERQRLTIELAKSQYESVKIQVKALNRLKDKRETLHKNIMQNFENLTKSYELATSRSEAVYGEVMPTFFDIRKNLAQQKGIEEKRVLTENYYNSRMEYATDNAEYLRLKTEKINALNKMEIDTFNLRTQLLKIEKNMIHDMISNSISNFVKIAKGEKITIDESKAQKELADALTALMYGEESVGSPELQALNGQSTLLKSIDEKMSELVAIIRANVDVLPDLEVENISRTFTPKANEELKTTNQFYEIKKSGVFDKDSGLSKLSEEEFTSRLVKQQKNLSPSQIDFAYKKYQSAYDFYRKQKDRKYTWSDLAQYWATSMHESGWGSQIAKNDDSIYTNSIGTKVDENWINKEKPYIKSNTKEYSNGVMENTKASFRGYANDKEEISDYLTFGKNDIGGVALQRSEQWATDPNYTSKLVSIYNIIGKILDGEEFKASYVSYQGNEKKKYVDTSGGNVTVEAITDNAADKLSNSIDKNLITDEQIDKFSTIFDATKLGNFMSITKALSSFSVILQGISNAKFAQKMKDTKADNEEFNRKFEMSIENLATNAEKLKKKTELVNIQARQEYDMTVAEEENAIENEIVAVNKQLLDQTQKMLEYLVAIEYNTANTDSILPSQNNVYNIEQAPVEDKKSNITTFNIKSPNGTQKSVRLSGSGNTTSVPSSSFSSFIQPMLTGSLVNTAGAMLGGFGGFNLGGINLGGGIQIPTGALSLGGYTPSFTSSFESTPSNPYALYSVFGGSPSSTGGYLDFGVPYQGGGIFSSIGDTVSNATNFMSSLHPKVLGQLGGGMTALLSGLTGDPLGGGIVSGLSLLGTALSNEWSGSLIKSGIDKFYPNIAKHLGENTLQYIGGGLSAVSGGFQLGTMLANKKFDAAGVIGSGMSLAGAYSALGESALAGALGGGALGAGLATGAIALPALALGVMATNAKKRQAKYKAAGEWNKKLEKYRDEQIQEQLKALRQQQNVLSNQASQQTKAVGQNEALRRSLMSAPLTASSVELYRSHQVSKRGGALGLGRKRKKWVMEGASATVGLSDFGYSSIANISDTYSLMNNITNSMKDIQKFLDSRGQHSGSKEDRKEWAEQKARLNASQMLYDQIKGLQESIVKSTVELTQSFFGFEMIGLNKDGNKAAEDEAIAKYDIGAWEKREDLLNVFLTDFMNAGNTVGKTIADIFVSGVSNAFVKNNSQLNQVINKIENAFKNIGKKVINTDSLLEAAKYELSSGKNTSSVYQSILDQLKEAGYGSEEAHKTAQSYLDAKNYKEFVQFLESMIATGNGMGDSVKDLISATNELKETQKHLEGEMRKFVDEWVQGGGNLSDIIGSMDNILSNSAKIIANIATTGGAIEGFEALKDLLNQKVLPNVQNSIIDALKENVFDIEGQINDYKKLMEAGKLTSGSMHSMVQDMGKLFDVLENPFDFELNEQLGISDEVLQKILAYKNTIDEINNALYERMTLDEKISYNQEKLSEEASKYKTQIAKQLEQGGVIDIGALGQISFKELEKKLQDLLAKGEPIPEELKEAIEQANGQYGTLNDTINKLEFDMRQAKVATQKFTEAWINGLINGDYETIKSELSEETQSLLDSVIQSLNADAWDSAGTSIGSSLATSILSTYSSKLINSTQMKDTAGILNKMLFDNMNFIDNNGAVNFDMMYQLSQGAQKMAAENEATRQRFEAINSMFDYTQDIRYSKLEKDISYKTSSTKESIYNINNYNTFSIGTLVADTLGLEALTRAIAPYMISVFKDLGVKI